MKGYFLKKDYINLAQYLIDVIKSEYEIVLEINGEYKSSFIIRDFSILESKLQIITDESEMVIIDIMDKQYIEFENNDINCLSFKEDGRVVNLKVM